MAEMACPLLRAHSRIACVSETEPEAAATLRRVGFRPRVLARALPRELALRALAVKVPRESWNLFKCASHRSISYEVPCTEKLTDSTASTSLSWRSHVSTVSIRCATVLLLSVDTPVLS